MNFMSKRLNLYCVRLCFSVVVSASETKRLVRVLSSKYRQHLHRPRRSIVIHSFVLCYVMHKYILIDLIDWLTNLHFGKYTLCITIVKCHSNLARWTNSNFTLILSISLPLFWLIQWPLRPIERKNDVDLKWLCGHQIVSMNKY